MSVSFVTEHTPGQGLSCWRHAAAITVLLLLLLLPLLLLLLLLPLQEGHCKPGEVLFGTDSHTCNAGAFGQFATGVGNTDAGFILGTGKLLIKVSTGPQNSFTTLTRS